MFSIKQLLARTITLIIWPMFLYMFFFYIHLTVLNKSGNGDGFYSSAFQSRLIGNSLYNASMPQQVAFGAIITLKNHKTGGGYLHSHLHLYPKGSGARQQQVRKIHNLNSFSLSQIFLSLRLQHIRIRMTTINGRLSHTTKKSLQRK